MGHGIAQLAASNGYKVVGVESNADALTTGKNRIEGSLGKLLARSVKKGKLTDEEAVAKQTSIMDNLSFSVDKTSLADCGEHSNNDCDTY
jgi:3-hydroxyacyl-CoA dehydrogenase